MGEDPSQIEREIRAERDNLGRNLQELERQTRDLADWRTHYRNHTGAALAAAFGGGLMIAMLATRRERAMIPADTYSSDAYPAEVHRSEPHRFRRASVGALRALGDNPHARQQVGEVWDRILDTLIGVASAKAIDVLGQYVPGFRREFEARHPRDEPQVALNR